MSKFSASKISATLVSISLLAVSIYPAFAQDASTTANPKRSSVTQKINIRQDIVKNELESLREKIASKTATLKMKLETFKDKRKAIIAERINTNLNAINENQTKQMQKHLNTMTNILDRLEARVNLGTSDIKDPAAARAAIALARASIATASATVLSQSQKDYTIVATLETKIKDDAKLQRDKLHADLLALRKLVINAKQSVSNAIRTAKSGKIEIGNEKEKEGTQSGQQ